MHPNEHLIGRPTVWAMAPTPFSGDGSSVDIESLANLARAVVSRGCTGFIALGVIAEPNTLTIDEKVTCLETLAEASPDVPLVATVMAADPVVSADEARTLTAALGDRLDGLMVPISHADPARFRAHLQAVHTETGHHLIVQDLPRATGIVMDVDDLAAAAADLSFVAAVKCESPPTFTRISRLCELTDLTLISGFGGIGLVDDVLSGASAVAVGVTPTATVVAAFDAARRGEYAESGRLIGERAALINLETQPGQSIAIRKEHWRRDGVIAHRTVRPPTMRWSEELGAHSAAHGIMPRA